MEASPKAAVTGGPGPSPANKSQTPREAQEADPRFRAAREEGQGDVGREMVAHAAMGAKLDDDEEVSALDWLLGSPPAQLYDVPVQVDTDRGRREVKFVLKELDAKVIDKIERKYIDQATGASVDKLSYDVEIVCTACVKLIDASGKELVPTSEEFRTFRRRNPQSGEVESIVDASTTHAMEMRFRKQLGLLSGVANEIRRKAGFDPERVGKAQRRLVDASLG